MHSNANRRGAITTAAKSLAGVSLGAVLAGRVPTALAQPSSDAAPDTQITVFILPDGLPGPDGNLHDSFVPSSIVVGAGVPTTLKFVNYDSGKHSVSSAALGLDIDVAAGTRDAARNRVPTVTMATITVPEQGVYRWDCDETCDGGAGRWAMSPGFGGDSQEGYMAGFIVAV